MMDSYVTRHGLTAVTRSQSVVFVFLHIFQCQIKFTVPALSLLSPDRTYITNVESVFNNMLSMLLPIVTRLSNEENTLVGFKKCLRIE